MSDDYEKYYEGSNRTQRLKRSENISPRELFRRFNWLWDKALYWGGVDESPAPVYMESCRSSWSILHERLRGCKPGLYSVELSYTPTLHENGPKVGNVCLVSAQRLSDANYLLSQAQYIKKEIETHLEDEDFDSWMQRIFMRLKRFSIAYNSANEKGVDQLVLEAHCAWIGSEQFRPSKRIDDKTLIEFLEEPATIDRRHEIASIVAGQRSLFYKRLPGLDHWYRIGQQLNQWTPDVLILFKNKAQCQRVSSLISNWPQLNNSAWLTMVREHQLLAVKPEAVRLLTNSPQIISAMKRLEQEPQKRLKYFLSFLGDIMQSENYFNWDEEEIVTKNIAFDESALDYLKMHLADEGINLVFGQEKRALKLLMLWMLDVKLTKTLQKELECVRSDLDPNYQLLTNLENFLKPLLVNPAPEVYGAIAVVSGRLSAVYTIEAVVNPLAHWLDLCRASCITGSCGSGGLRYALKSILNSTGYLEDIKHENPDVLFKVIYQHGHSLAYSVAGIDAQVPSHKNLLKAYHPDKTFNILALLCRIPETYHGMIHELCNSGLIHWLDEVARYQPKALEKACEFLFLADDSWQELEYYDAYSWAELFKLSNLALAENIADWTVSLYNEGFKWSQIVYLLDDIMSFLNRGQEKLQRQQFLNKQFFMIDRLFENCQSMTSDKRGAVDAFSSATWVLDILFYAETHNIRFVNLMDDILKFNQSNKDINFESEDLELDILLSAGENERLLNCFRQQIQQSYSYPVPAVNTWNFLKKHPMIQKFLNRSCDRPELITRIKQLLQRMALALRLQSSYQLSTQFTVWEELISVDESDVTIPDSVPKALRDNYSKLLVFRKNSKQTDLPKSIKKILKQEKNYEKELSKLESINGASINESQRIRIDRLTDYLEDKESLQDYVEKELGSELTKQLMFAKLAFLEHICQDAISRYWRLMGAESAIVHNDQHWDNALFMSMGIDENRRLLKELIRAEASGHTNWIAKHPTNKRFIDGLKTHNINTDVWLSDYQDEHKVFNSKWTLYLEMDPIKVLEMGNLFGTCLSLGGDFAYSTVANAIEINKRVIYIRNEKGHVIGRKLIALSREGVLYGFNSYGKSEWTKILLDLFCYEFALKCKSRIATTKESNNMEDSEVKLFAKWYNDGAEDFDWWINETHKGDKRIIADSLATNFSKLWNNKRDETIRALIYLGEKSIEILQDNIFQIKESRHLRTLTQETLSHTLKAYMETIVKDKDK
ncbi:MAG: hypothetical protein HRT89_03050 [Lentisphaeria bacterium]|nr:hypothetical protein [Lentisphaeria bacterium]